PTRRSSDLDGVGHEAQRAFGGFCGLGCRDERLLDQWHSPRHHEQHAEDERTGRDESTTHRSVLWSDHSSRMLKNEIRSSAGTPTGSIHLEVVTDDHFPFPSLADIVQLLLVRTAAL